MGRFFFPQQVLQPRYLEGRGVPKGLDVLQDPLVAGPDPYGVVELPVRGGDPRLPERDLVVVQGAVCLELLELHLVQPSRVYHGRASPFLCVKGLVLGVQLAAQAAGLDDDPPRPHHRVLGNEGHETREGESGVAIHTAQIRFVFTRVAGCSIDGW